MNTADNNEKKEADKRTLVIGGAAVLICIASIVMLALRPGSSENVSRLTINFPSTYI